MRVGMPNVRRLMTAMVAASALAACSGGDDGTEPTPAISIALSSATLSVTQGTTGSVTVNLTRSGGFTGDVALGVDGLPSATGNSAFAPPSLTASASSSVLTIGAAGTATPGVVNVTVRATGTGVTAATATLAITIVAAPTPSFALAVAPTTLSLAQSGTASSTVTLTRAGGFTGGVTLAAENLPAGVTAAFNPASPVTGNTSTLTLTASATATLGAATVTVRGTGTGVTAQTATIALTVTAPAPVGFSLGLNPATLAVTQGTNGTSTVNITRTGGFAGSVNLTASGLPNGVTAAFNPVDATGNTSTLTLTASATAATGAATVTIKGTSAGQTDQTTTLALTVNVAAGYTLSLTPTTLSIAQGTNGTSTVNITRTGGFTGTVNLTATGLPNGVTAAFNPAAATGNTSTLTLTASATAATGAATVVIHGNSGTLAEQTTNLALTVTATGGGTGNTTYEFCTVDQTPIWLAVQDGATGTWTRVTPTGTKFQFNITQAKAGVAFVTQSGTPFIGSVSQSFASRLTKELKQELLLRNRPSRAFASRSLALSYDLTIEYGTQAELKANGTGLCLTGGGKTVNGTVASLSATQSAEITLGTASASASAANTSFQLTDVPDGALDQVAARSTTNTTTFTTVPDKFIIRRGVNAAANSSLPVLDFGSSEAFDPAQANITIGNIGTDVGFVLTSYFTAAGSSAAGASLSGFSLPSAGPFKYYGVPTAKQAAGDLHVAIAFAFPNLQTLDQARLAALFFKDPTDRTVTLGAALTVPTVNAAATTPYVRFHATGPIQAEYGDAINLEFVQSSAGRNVSITATKAYLAGSGTYDLTVPDFSGVAGWDNNWGPKVGASTEWTATAYSISGIGFGSPNPVEGSTYKAAFRTGTFTP